MGALTGKVNRRIMEYGLAASLSSAEGPAGRESLPTELRDGHPVPATAPVAMCLDSGTLRERSDDPTNWRRKAHGETALIHLPCG